MKKNGFIYIYTVIIITILALIFYFSYSYITNNAALNSNLYESEVIKYRLESLINLKISEDSFTKDLENFYVSNDLTRKLKVKNIFKDVDNFKMSMSRTSVRSDENFKLKASVNYKKNKLYGLCYASFINKIYKKEDGVLNSKDFTSEELSKYKDKINNMDLRTSSSNKIIRLDGDFKIKQKQYYAVIYEEVHEVINGEEKIVENELYNLMPSDILIQEKGSLEFVGNLGVYVYYILGSNVIFNGNDIYGLMYLKNTNISGDFNFSGYLIDIYDVSKKEKIKTSFTTIKPNYKNLPDFFKFQVESIKI